MRHPLPVRAGRICTSRWTSSAGPSRISENGSTTGGSRRGACFHTQRTGEATSNSIISSRHSTSLAGGAKKTPRSLSPPRLMIRRCSNPSDTLSSRSGGESVDDLLGIARHGGGDPAHLIRFPYLPPEDGTRHGCVPKQSRAFQSVQKTAILGLHGAGGGGDAGSATLFADRGVHGADGACDRVSAGCRHGAAVPRGLGWRTRDPERVGSYQRPANRRRRHGHRRPGRRAGSRSPALDRAAGPDRSAHARHVCLGPRAWHHAASSGEAPDA